MGKIRVSSFAVLARRGRVLATCSLVVALLLFATNAAIAGIADTPLPQFSDGKQSQLIMSIPGVVKRHPLQTDFLCTSLASTPVDVGVEVFSESGALQNNVHTGGGAVLNVNPGQTVTFGTSAT